MHFFAQNVHSNMLYKSYMLELFLLCHFVTYGNMIQLKSLQSVAQI